MKYILMSFIIISSISCRSYREKTQSENSGNSLFETRKGIHYGFKVIEKDSQNRVWYFVTDSILSFHPEYGLFSNGGRLHISESRIGLQQLQVEVDSLEKIRHAQSSTVRENQTRTWYKNPWWIWAIGILCVIIIYKKLIQSLSS
ncbi:hypothetical protein [Sphingobacterium chuzhouense]|uniref:Lipoprotein n=1 Tax=Sphingobacterium chuzhouense TaxID=1742264 RepID=A0ABR7XXF5_9SPHI|nr:hypothetical protein [Sphingobacterium chuzhouense]MBD1423740.1 hypothetical protein [Sphingobacterium chuzhouense]